MNDHHNILPFPRSRRRHMMHGLLEVDATVPSERIRQSAAHSSERLSFTAFIAACLGQSVDVDRSLHAYRD